MTMPQCNVYSDGKILYSLPLQYLKPMELAKVYMYVVHKYGYGPRVLEVEDALISLNSRKELDELDEMKIEIDSLRSQFEDALEDRDYYKSELEDCIDEQDDKKQE